MIVVTASTGNVGHQVLESILDRGEPVRVIVRNPSRLPAHVDELRIFVGKGRAGPAWAGGALLLAFGS